MKARLIYAFLGLSLVTLPATSQSTRRWSPQEDGSITWNIRNDLPHSDHIEMSGKSVSVVLRYGVDREGNFTLNKGMVWPLLRTVPNNTHASLMRRSAWNPLDAVFVNSRSLTEEKVESISLNGILKSRKTKSDGREKRKAIFEAKTKCAQKSRLLPPSGQNTSVVQTPFESCLKDAFLLNFLLKYHLKTHCQFSKKSYLYIVVMLPLCIPSRPHS